jgi:phosphoglycerate kinase
MTTVKDFQFNGQRVLIRVDFNVPLDDNLKVTDDTRIRATIPTIKEVLARGGRPVLMSHLGRPKGAYDDKFSLSHIVADLEKLVETKVNFAIDCVGDEAVEASNNLKEGEILLLENLRFHEGETNGDKQFAKELAKNGDFYINDAFGTAHRAHASTAVIAEYFEGKKAFGFVMAAEIENVNKVLNSTDHPVTAIVGGAKVSSKIAILENLVERLDNLVIAGGMAFTFIKAKGGAVGSSLVEDEYINTAMEILEKARKHNVKVFLPIDTVNADKFDNAANTSITDADKIPEGWMGLDVGTKTIAELDDVLKSSKTILWNGPMGVFEFSNFETGTKKVAEIISGATAQGTFSIVGGGDSVAAIKKFGMERQVSYVSTGGGAMLEYLEGKALPGIQAILN